MTCCEQGSELLSVVAFKQITITGFGHPTGPSEVALVDASSALFILAQIETENDRGNLAPIGPLGVRVQQSQIGDLVGQIIVRDLVRLRRLVEQVGVAHRSLKERGGLAHESSWMMLFVRRLAWFLTIDMTATVNSSDQSQNT